MHGSRSMWICAASLFAAVACHPTQAEPTKDAAASPTPTTVPAPTTPSIEGDAVVRVGAKLYVAATGDDGFEVPELGPSPGLAVHVVGEEQGRIAIETVAASEHHCAAVLESLADVRLRLFVAREDLVTVLTEDAEHAFDDGTKVLLSRGVPSAKSGELVARGTLVRVPVDASRFGLAFAPSKPRALDGGQGQLADLAAHPLEYDGRALVEEHLHRDRGWIVRYAATERGDRALVTVRNACLEVTASVALARLQAPAKPSQSALYDMKGPKDPVPSIAPSETEPSGRLDPDGVYREEYTSMSAVFVEKHYDVKADTPIWTADGRPIGKVVTDHRFRTNERYEGERVCFDVQLTTARLQSVALCFAADAPTIAPKTGYGSDQHIKGPRVRQADAEVKGALDRDIIRRIVRAHINEVRHCYAQGLERDSKLAGKIAIAFTIDVDGDVTKSDVAESTVADASVGTCVGKAVKRWKFPKPEDGKAVQVTYPFTLEPG